MGWIRVAGFVALTDGTLGEKGRKVEVTIWKEVEVE